MTKTLRSFEELDATLAHQDAKRVTEADLRDDTADEEQELRLARTEKPRVFQNAAPVTVQHMLEEDRAKEARKSDIAAVAPLVYSLADFFSDEIEGVFAERVCMSMVRMAADRALWLREKQIPTVLDEMKQLRRPTGEIDTVRLESKLAYLGRLEREAELWDVLAEGAKTAFKTATGTDFVERPRGKPAKREDIAAAQLDAVLSRYGRKA